MSGIRWGVGGGRGGGGAILIHHHTTADVGVPLALPTNILYFVCQFYILFVSSLSVDDRVRKVRNEARDYAAWLRGEAGTFFNHQSTTTRALYACVGPAYID